NGRSIGARSAPWATARNIVALLGRATVRIRLPRPGDVAQTPQFAATSRSKAEGEGFEPSDAPISHPTRAGRPEPSVLVFPREIPAGPEGRIAPMLGESGRRVNSVCYL